MGTGEASFLLVFSLFPFFLYMLLLWRAILDLGTLRISRLPLQTSSVLNTWFTLHYLTFVKNKNNNKNYLAVGIMELQSQEGHQRSINYSAKGRPKPQNLIDLVFSIISYYLCHLENAFRVGVTSPGHFWCSSIKQQFSSYSRRAFLKKRRYPGTTPNLLNQTLGRSPNISICFFKPTGAS